MTENTEETVADKKYQVKGYSITVSQEAIDCYEQMGTHVLEEIPDEFKDRDWMSHDYISRILTGEEPDRVEQKQPQ